MSKLLHFPTYQKGLSLVELMISLALGAILSAGVLTLYFDSNNTDRLGTALARIQESGRFALEFLARDIRMAGYQGCADPELVDVRIIARNPPTSDFFSTAVRGFEVANSNWANGAEFDGTPVESRAKIGSDVIAIQRATTNNVQLTGNMDALNANIKITNNSLGFEQNDLVVISDCEAADMFRITNNPNAGGGGDVTLTHANGANIDNRLGKRYNTTAQVMNFSSVVYFVGDTGRKDSRKQPIYALYLASDNLEDSGTSSFNIQELVEGVESMQILYGERLDTGSIRYVPANTSGLIDTNIESIRLGLLLASTDSVLNDGDKQTYFLPGEDITPESESGSVQHPEDKRIRRTFNTTIKIRNRGEG